MPNVAGKKFPYTRAGKSAAKKMRKKIASKTKGKRLRKDVRWQSVPVYTGTSPGKRHELKQGQAKKMRNPKQGCTYSKGIS